jgi:BMFP domain-containing protein YqiC
MEFFKEYKTKSNDEILKTMKLLREEFDKTKQVIFDLTHHLEDMEKKFNVLNDEMKKRKPNG